MAAAVCVKTCHLGENERVPPSLVDDEGQAMAFAGLAACLMSGDASHVFHHILQSSCTEGW